MCGRYALGLQPHNVMHMVTQVYPDTQLDEWVNEDRFTPRHNIAPRSQAPVIHNVGSSEGQPSGSTQHAVMHTMKWGLVPHWSKHEDKTLSTTNARAENLVEGGGMWGSIKGRKRCAVVCQGYYEWLKKGKERIPHFIKHKDGSLMLMAGLYDVANLEGEKEPLHSFTIVTTDARKDLAWLHDRQPVILSTKAQLNTWLDTSSQAWSKELTEIVKPHSDNGSPLEYYPVPKEVGKVGTESPTFIEPVSQRKDGIEAMFAKQTKKATPSKPKEPPTSPHREVSSQDAIGSGSQKDTKWKRTIASSSPERGTSPKKRKRSEATEELDDVQIIESPSPSPRSPKSKQPSKTSPKKAKVSPDTSGSSKKITQFFSKDK